MVTTYTIRFVDTLVPLHSQNLPNVVLTLAYLVSTSSSICTARDQRITSDDGLSVWWARDWLVHNFSLSNDDGEISLCKPLQTGPHSVAFVYQHMHSSGESTCQPFTATTVLTSVVLPLVVDLLAHAPASSQPGHKPQGPQLLISCTVLA